MMPFQLNPKSGGQHNKEREGDKEVSEEEEEEEERDE